MLLLPYIAYVSFPILRKLFIMFGNLELME